MVLGKGLHLSDLWHEYFASCLVVYSTVHGRMLYIISSLHWTISISQSYLDQVSLCLVSTSVYFQTPIGNGFVGRHWPRGVLITKLHSSSCLHASLFPCNCCYHGAGFTYKPTIQARWRALLGLCHFLCTYSLVDVYRDCAHAILP
jgi:hypothetical protein